jgi:quercetin dioxygenase-like cupin family protein
MKNILLTLCAVLLIHNPATASEITSTILEQGSTSWNGGAFAYPEGEPKISIQKITVKVESEEVPLPLHCHPVPLAAYVLKGSVRVKIASTGKSRLFKEGDALIEVSNTWHQGVFTEDSELLVIYAGEKDIPLSIKKEDDSPFAKKCK